MATINYKGMELEEITKPQIFDPPKTMVVDDGQNSPRTSIVTAILAQSSGHSFRVLTDNSVICYSRCAPLPEKPAPRRVTNRGLGSMGGEVTLAKLAPENGGIAPRYFGNLSEDVMAITERYRNDDLCVHEGRAFIFDSDSKNWKELDMAPVCGKKCDTRESKCRWAVYIRSLEETKARLVRSHDFVVDHKRKAFQKRSRTRIGCNVGCIHRRSFNRRCVMSRKNRWRPMRVKILGHWLWGMCKMAKKKAKGRAGCFPRQVFPPVKTIQSMAYRKFVIRRFEREGYFTIGCPSFKFRSPE